MLFFADKRHPVTVSGITPHSAKATPTRLRNPMTANAMAVGNCSKKDWVVQTEEELEEELEEEGEEGGGEEEEEEGKSK